MWIKIFSWQLLAQELTKIWKFIFLSMVKSQTCNLQVNSPGTALQNDPINETISNKSLHLCVRKLLSLNQSGRGHTFARENKTWQIGTYQCESYLCDFFKFNTKFGLFFAYYIVNKFIKNLDLKMWVIWTYLHLILDLTLSPSWTFLCLNLELPSLEFGITCATFGIIFAGSWTPRFWTFLCEWN